MTQQKIVFLDPRKTATISLPSFEGSEVNILKQLLVGQQSEIRERFPNLADNKHPDSFNSMIAMVQKGIVSWNFTDNDGNDLPITEEILKKFPNKDIMLLIEQISETKISQEGGETDKKKE